MRYELREHLSKVSPLKVKSYHVYNTELVGSEVTEIKT